MTNFGQLEWHLTISFSWNFLSNIQIQKWKKIWYLNQFCVHWLKLKLSRSAFEKCQSRVTINLVRNNCCTETVSDDTLRLYNCTTQQHMGRYYIIHFLLCCCWLVMPYTPRKKWKKLSWRVNFRWMRKEGENYCRGGENLNPK